MTIKPEVDKETGMKYFRVREGKVKSTLELGDDVLVDIDKWGRVLGVEVFPRPTPYGVMITSSSSGNTLRGNSFHA